MLGAGCPGCGADGAYFVEKAHFCMSFMLWLHAICNIDAC